MRKAEPARKEAALEGGGDPGITGGNGVASTTPQAVRQMPNQVPAPLLNALIELLKKKIKIKRFGNNLQNKMVWLRRTILFCSFFQNLIEKPPSDSAHF